MKTEFETTLETLQTANTGSVALDSLMADYAEAIAKPGEETASSGNPEFTQNLDDAILSVPAGMAYRLDCKEGHWTAMITDRHGKIFRGWHANPRLATCIASVRALNALQSFPDPDNPASGSGEFEE